MDRNGIIDVQVAFFAGVLRHADVAAQWEAPLATAGSRPTGLPVIGWTFEERAHDESCCHCTMCASS